MGSLRHAVACTSFLALPIGLGGCDQLINIAANPAFQSAVLTSVSSHILEKVFDIFVSPAHAETVGGNEPPAPRTAEGCKRSNNLNTPCEAAKAEAATATLTAFEDLQRTFGCHYQEPAESCQARFRDAVEKEAGNRVVEGRALSFAKAWPGCRDSIRDGDLHDAMLAADECMTQHGFGVEIAALNKVFYGEA